MGRGEGVCVRKKKLYFTLTQRAMERKMLNLKIKDKVPYTEKRKRTRVQDIVQFVLKQ